MKKRWITGAVAAIAALALTIGFSAASAAPKKAAGATNITLQLKWVPQAQFAGYYAAVKEGFYAKEGLNVTLKNGGPDIVPETVVASNQAQFGVDWLPSLLAARDKGTDLVNVAQVFARSGMTQLTWKSSGIKTIAQMKGKKVGNWLGGNQYELFAALTKNGIDPNNKSDVTIVQQPFTMDLFLKGQIDSASAMTYNELAQVLESTNPKTGKLYTLNDLNVIKMQNAGTGMLEDGLFTTGSWLKGSTNGIANSTLAIRFVKASLEGWIYCRDHEASCVNITLSYGPTLPKGHQTWQINEINKLIWPSDSAGIGVMDPAAFNQTATIARQFGVISKAPSGAYTSTYAAKAVAELKAAGVDVTGTSWKPAVVKLTAGGK
ncbi:MAG TPA: ABC transporter substrate-binding protein [Gaiellaceae bacterium]|nr:ABC transporter substrate-binding protein [Gaiellaceae bacterium]